MGQIYRDYSIHPREMKWRKGMTVENGAGIKFNTSTAMAKIRLHAAKEEEVTVLERSFLQSISYTNHESSPLTFHLDCANAGTTLRGDMGPTCVIFRGSQSLMEPRNRSLMTARGRD